MTRIPKSVKSTWQILRGDNHILQSLVAQSQVLLRIEAVIRHYVDKNFAVCSFKNNQLVLVASTGANATRLRYRQRNLISALRREGFQISTIKIKVQPEFQATERPQIERFLSPETAQHLMSSAQYIEHVPLKKALMNLSKRADQLAAEAISA